MNYDQLMQDHENYCNENGLECEYMDLGSMLLNWPTNELGQPESYTELRNNWELHRRLRALDQRVRDSRSAS